ncbi:DUF2780 domain-containing protein [Gilvimarinus xylanilyticus]|uniref:DUF2780 domain-containing protein n=1 Tax=Gilvimarinus xylanilyticus TaxID=2944139 RepID=A0A9X2KTI4_9GAMM|nr:DUF2780 domain-containing protein [Gilvimarinus xylanilyticus]MCP8899294.1 DUF2780 domain-containing protein [Gilvimarinus xylanilyticus]
MNKLLIAALTLFFAVSAHGFDLNDVDKALGSNSESAMPSGLVNNLTESLGVSSDQAAGGTSALLALAANQLSGENAAALGDILPTGGSGGLSSQLIGQITSMDSVKSVFNTLGMDPTMVNQFAPIVLDYVGNNGGKELLGSLSSLWGQ